MSRKVYLTTADNPYDPSTQFAEWYSYDLEKGYDTCGYLDRIARTSDAMSDVDNEIMIENAIDEIVKLNLLGNYKKLVVEDSPGM